MDKDKKNPRASDVASDAPASNPEMEEILRKLQPEMRGAKPSPDAIAAALEAAQRLAAEADAEQASDDALRELTGDSATTVCRVCGYRNRQGNKFCGKCGVSVMDAAGAATPGVLKVPSHELALPPDFFLDHEPETRPATTRPSGQETHHYHHHYHHHYFPGGEAMAARSAADAMRDSARDPMRDLIREDKLRPIAALRGDMSRAEAAVRRIAHEWVLACNTKHLDDLLDLYVPDALVLRSNCPPVRGAAAVREFFFGALDAGLGEAEVEPLRVEVVGDLAYEAGRCKALIPGATGKRREERGKYLWVCARQNNGEWKLAADCWASDLTLSTQESDVPLSAGVKTTQPRKNP
ncbi:MAG TPA: nuclear transport factor 2 family protein [Candidatus Sulfotelmatobacter sp.]|nr:nuclear transport factor 2 family protein [Candidatus Sulfotelmatobacter sp.]